MGSLLLAPTLACAEPESADLISGEGDWTSRSHRVAIAMKLDEGFRPLYDSIPNLSPEQEAWLSKERTRFKSLSPDAKSDALKEFASSRAFHIEYAKGGLSRVLSAIDCVREEPKAEFQCWAFLAQELLNEAIWDYVLRLGLFHSVAFPPNVSMLYKEETELGPDYLPGLYARGILEHIVTPGLTELERTR